jgi:hypothetical protein
MTISRMSVCGFLAILLWLPSVAGGQGTKQSDPACRAAMDNLFEQAKDLSIDETVLNDELTKSKAKCGTKEADSIQRLPRFREQIKAQKKELSGSSGRTERSGKAAEKNPTY